MSFIVGTVSAPLQLDTRPFAQGINRSRGMGNAFVADMTRTLQGFSQGLTQAGEKLTRYITVPIAAASVAVFKFGKDFEYELSKVTGLVGVSRSQVDEWGKDILSLSPQLGKAPKELAEALFFVTSAGIKGAEAMKVLEMAGKASAAGLGETRVVADLVTSAMNAYGVENLSASKATDILTAAVREGKAEASELAATMGQVLPLAAELGVSFDQVAATQAAMTRTGTGAAEAATQLKGILAGLIKPSKQAQDQLAAMGTNAEEMRKKIREEGLLKALMDLRAMTNKYGEEAMARVFPNIRALMGVLDLMGSNLEDNQKVFENVANSTGVLDEAFKAATDTVQFKWDVALSQIKATAIKFFDTLKVSLVPMLEKFSTILGMVADKLSSLPIKQQQVIIGFTLLGGVVGPILATIGISFTALIGIIGGFITAITTIGTVVAAIGAPALAVIAAAIPLIVAEITVIIGAIAGLVASFIHLFKTNKEFKTNVLNTWTSIKNNAVIIFEEIRKVAVLAIEKIKSFWERHGDDILKFVEHTWYEVLYVVENAMELIKDAVVIGTAIIQGDWEKAFNVLKDTSQKIFSEIVDIILYNLNTLKEIIILIFEEIKIIITKKINEIKDSITNKFEEMKENIRNNLIGIKNLIINKFEEIKEGIKNKLTETSISILEWFSNMPEMIKQKLIGWKKAITNWMIAQNIENIKQFTIWGKNITDWFNSIPEKLNKRLEKWKSTIKNKFSEMREAIKLKLTDWGLSITVWFGSIPAKMRKSFKSWWDTLKKEFDNARKMIKSKLNNWWTSIKEWFSNIHKRREIKNAGKNMIDKVSQGNKEKKRDFMDKLGKLIVDVMVGAGKFAFIAAVATGREIIKRLLKGIKETNFKSIGRNIVQSIIDGIFSMDWSLSSAANWIAGKISDRLPRSPAKIGPLKDLDRLDFAGPIQESLEKAEREIEKSFLGNLVIGAGINPGFHKLMPANNSNSTVFSNNNFNFHGIQDVVSFMNEMQNVMKRYGGKFYE